MPAFRYAVPFFIVFGGGTMGHCRKFVLLGGFPVRLVHGVSSRGSVGAPFYSMHEADQSLGDRRCFSAMAWKALISTNMRSGGPVSGANFALATTDSAPSRLGVRTKGRRPRESAAQKSIPHNEEVGAARAVIGAIPSSRETSMKATEQLHHLGQSLWLDNITRGLLTSGTLERYIRELSITGLTSNPSIFDHAIRNANFYDEAIRAKMQGAPAVEKLFFELALEDLTKAADLFRPIHDATNGVDGWVSLEVSPLLADEPANTLEAAKRLFALADRPNLFIKIPGTPKGLSAIEDATFAGIPVNVTLLFSRDQYLKAAGAYMRGIERRIQASLDPAVHSVASIFISRWDKAVAGKEPDGLRNRIGIAVAQQAYAAYCDLLISPRWLKLAAKGAAAQRLLWASTGTKDPKASDTLYVSALAAPDTVNTMPEATLLAFADHGQVPNALPADGGDCETVLDRFARGGIDAVNLARQLQREGAEAFVKSWNDLLLCIQSKAHAANAGAGA
jgi:transaldolase